MLLLLLIRRPTSPSRTGRRGTGEWGRNRDLIEEEKEELRLLPEVFHNLDPQEEVHGRPEDVHHLALDACPRLPAGLLFSYVSSLSICRPSLLSPFSLLSFARRVLFSPISVVVPSGSP